LWQKYGQPVFDAGEDKLLVLDATLAAFVDAILSLSFDDEAFAEGLQPIYFFAYPGSVHV